jgi:hypothetical protein
MLRVPHIVVKGAVVPHVSRRVPETLNLNPNAARAACSGVQGAVWLPHGDGERPLG